MIISPRNFTPIVKALSHQPLTSRIEFTQEENHYKFEVKTSSIWQRINQQERINKTSLNCLKNLIGPDRFSRIIQRPELGEVAKRLNQRALLTHDSIKKIFLALGDIRLDDLEEAARLEGKNLNQYTKQELDQLYHALIPFEKVTDVFMGRLPSIYYFDKAFSSGKGYEGWRERVWTDLHSRQRNLQVSADPFKQNITDIEALTSRLGDREPPCGTIIRLHKGYYAVDKVFSKKGSYITVLRELTGTHCPIILCRGTATRLRATNGLWSAVNDLMPELGSMGIQSIWHEFSAYLEQHSMREVEVMGKSLGGAHAQYLTLLITGKSRTRVASLVTNCSVGVPLEVNTLFQQVLEETQKEKPVIWMVRNSGIDELNEVDYVPFIGGAHFRSTPDRTRAFYLIPSHSANEVEDCLPTHHSLIKKLMKFAFSFPFAHQRQTTLRGFIVREETNIEAEANKGNQLEKLRSFVARVFNWPYHFFDRELSFQRFYQSQN